MPRTTSSSRAISLRSRILPLLAACLAALALASCVGVDATATISADGSGSLDLHYAVSKMAASFGALEANSSYLPLPVSREDLDRTIRGIEGLSLASYAQKEEGDDLVVDAKLGFTSAKALAAFLDPRGERAVYSEEGGRHQLALVMAAGSPPLDADVKKLVDVAFEHYRISLGFKLPSKVFSAGIGVASAGGLRVDYSSPVTALIESPTKIEWTLVW